jgi:hypothetical protein
VSIFRVYMPSTNCFAEIFHSMSIVLSVFACQNLMKLTRTSAVE